MSYGYSYRGTTRSTNQFPSLGKPALLGQPNHSFVEPPCRHAVGLPIPLRSKCWVLAKAYCHSPLALPFLETFAAFSQDDFLDTAKPLLPIPTSDSSTRRTCPVTSMWTVPFCIGDLVERNLDSDKGAKWRTSSRKNKYTAITDVTTAACALLVGPLRVRPPEHN